MIVLKDVCKTWDNGENVLKNINITINSGEFVAIIGLSGAGKTTLIKTLNKMTPINSGSINITLQEYDLKTKRTYSKNYNVNKLSNKELRNLRTKIGLITQNYGVIEQQTVYKNVLNGCVPKMNFWRSLFGFFNKEEKDLALNSLDKLGMLDKTYVKVGNLSGGQQQRVALARTLTQSPQIIIADEPVSALDPTLANQVMQDFQKINKRDKTVIIMNIHHVELALKYATRIIGIKNGEIIFDGKKEQVNNDILKNIYETNMGSNYENVWS